MAAHDDAAADDDDDEDDDVRWIIYRSAASHPFKRFLLVKVGDAHSLNSVSLDYTSEFCSSASKERSFFSKVFVIDPDFFS